MGRALQEGSLVYKMNGAEEMLGGRNASYLVIVEEVGRTVRAPRHRISNQRSKEPSLSLFYRGRPAAPKCWTNGPMSQLVSGAGIQPRNCLTSSDRDTTETLEARDCGGECSTPRARWSHLVNSQKEARVLASDTLTGLVSLEPEHQCEFNPSEVILMSNRFGV